MRAAVLVLALLLAGCAAPEDEPLQGAAVKTPPRAECGRFTLAADPPAARVGEDVVLKARLENCGAEPIERATPCLSREWNPRVVVDGREWTMMDGSAGEGLVCMTAIGHWRVEPGAALEESFRWNGTLTDCRAYAEEGGCRTRDAPPGTYVVRSRLAQLSGDEQGPAWETETTLTLLAR